VCRLLFLLSFLFADGQDNPQTAGLGASGLQALDHGDYTAAEQAFSKLIAADPKDYSAFFNLALAETALKKNAAAIEHYKQTLALKPNLYEAELNLGILYLRNHQAGDALPILRDAAQGKPKEARPKRYLADSLLAIGNLDAAAATYREALALDPKQAGAELGLGQSLLRQNKLDEALPHYRQAAQSDPHLKSFLLEMAAAFAKSNRSNEAIALLKEFPENAGAREELGRLYLANNQGGEAVEEFQAAVGMSPTPANRLALAAAYLKNNQPKLAAPILEEALAANPNDYDLRMAVGRLHRDGHDYKTAAAQFLAAASMKPDSVEAWNEAAGSFILAEQYGQALAALDKIHNLNADKPGNLYFRAMVLDKLHQVKPALASYQKFLQISEGKFPDQEFIARQRSRLLEKEANR
jgi:tetratricopeptide (TPR) repeat protein